MLSSHLSHFIEFIGEENKLMSWKSNAQYSRFKDEKSDEYDKKLRKENQDTWKKMGDGFKYQEKKANEQNKEDWKKLSDKYKPKDKNLIDF